MVYKAIIANASSCFPLVDTASLVPGCYSDYWRDIMGARHSEYIAESGRGSLKSSVILTTAPIMLMMNDPHLCGVAFRRVGNTLRDSIFAAFHADALALKEIDPQAYENEYLGIATGRKGKVFTNLERRDIAQDEVDGFKWIRCGIDWGYVNDPWVFVQVAYDSKTATVYVIQEDKGLRLSDEQSAERVISHLSDDRGKASTFNPKAIHNRIYADSAEQKSIASYRTIGLNCIAASKWKGSVTQGLKWLQTRRQIVIDKACALCWAEFSAYDYELDKDDSPIEEAYQDKNNHTIDAVRYALSSLIANKKEV